MKPKFRSLAAAFAPLSRSSLIVCASLCAATSASADKTWTGATDGAWGTTTNWLEGALPGTAETVIFDSNSTSNLSTIALGANRTVRGIDLSNPASDVTIVAGSTLTLAGGGIDMSTATANFINNAGLNLTTGQQSFDVASTRSITLAGLSRTTSGGVGNVNVGASLNIPSSGGSVKIGSAAIPVLIDGQNNPWVTYGSNSFAGTDASGFVVPVTPTAWTASIGTSFFSVPYAVGADFTQSGNGGVYGIVFNDATTAYTLTLSGSTTFTGRAVLMTSGCVGGTITGGSLRPNRVASGAGGNAPMNFIQNSLVGDLRISNLSNGSSSTTVSLVKSGVGKMIITGGTFHTGGTFINGGTLQVGEGAAAGSLGNPTSMVVIQPSGALVMNVSADITLSGAFSGSGPFTQQGSGITTLGGTNTAYTGVIAINGGSIAATSLDNLGTGTDMTINGGQLKFLGAFDPTSRAVTIGSSGASFDTNGNDVTFDSSFETGSNGAVVKNGAGALTLSATNDYSGGTTVNAGKLVVNATNATGTGSVTVNTGGSVGGSGSIGGTLVLASGAVLTPGASVGTLTTGSLNLQSGSTATYEFSTTPANDQVAVTNSGGLTINGGAITLLQENSALPFATAGTYNLISYSGAISGAGVSSLSVANPQAGYSYTFGATGTNVTLTIATTGVVSQWNFDGGDSWTNATRWTPNTVPNVAGATANFSTELTAPATVTLDGSKTVGAITFTSSTFGYTIAQGSGGSLILNNGANGAAIVDNAGTHEISAPITLSSNTGISSFAAEDGLTLSGVISGAGSLTKTGPGSLSLLGANDFTGLLTLSGGATTFALDGLGDGNLNISGASLIWDANSANTQDISNRTITFGADPVVFDTNGNDVALANSIGNGGSAALTKAGLGRLTFASDADFTGDITISAGVLQLGAGGATGQVSGNIINNAELDVNLAGASTLANLVSGTGSFVHSGTGSLTLTAQNTFNGTTTISESTGSLILTDALNLQNSTLNYDVIGGSLNVGTLTAVTLGGLSGDKNLALENTDLTPAALALTVGGNNSSTAYSGILSGSGSLTKAGTGELTLTGANTYTGNTLVAGGILTLGLGGEINTPAANFGMSAVAGAQMHLTGGDLTAVDGALGVGSGGLFMEEGTATFSGILYADGSTGSTNSGPIRVYGGSLTVPTIRLGRGGLNTSTEPTGAPVDINLYVNGGTVSVSGDLYIGTGNNLPNSSVVTRVDSGSLTVAGAISVGLNNSGRWSYIDINGGDLISTGTGVNSGVVLGGPNVGRAAFLMRSGIATVERIQFGRDAVDGQGLLNISGGELYVGSEGILVGSTGVYTSEVRLSGGLIGAKANWSTSMPVNVSGLNQSIVMASDANANPFNISFTGALTGTGGLIKDGEGTVTLSGGHSYEGVTTVNAGTLDVTTATFNDAATVSVYTTGKLKLSFSGGDKIDSLIIDDVYVADSGTPGTWGAPGSGATNESAAFEGPGILYVGMDVPTSGYSSWASDPANGLTAGVNDGPTQDPDNDGIENMLEFVLGGHPMTSSTNKLPALTVNATNFIFTFTREDDSEAEVTLKFQHGSNLTGWTDVVIGADTASSGSEVVVTENADAPDSITVTVPKGANTKLFGRIQAVK